MEPQYCFFSHNYQSYYSAQKIFLFSVRKSVRGVLVCDSPAARSLNDRWFVCFPNGRIIIVKPIVGLPLNEVD